MAKTETQINLKINKGNYAKIQENLSQIGENELIITDDKNIPVPDELNEGKGIISHNNKYVFEDVQLKNLITDIETHKTENGSYPSTKAVYDYCQTLGIPVLKVNITASPAYAQYPQSTHTFLSAEQGAFIDENKFKPMVVEVVENGSTNWSRFFFVQSWTKNTQAGGGQGKLASFYAMYYDQSNTRWIQISYQAWTWDGTYLNRFNSWWKSADYEMATNKKTSVSSYSSSNIYYPTTKAVYDFVKGETKYIVVSDYSALPTTNVSEGMLAYCQQATVVNGYDYYSGFYQYNGSSWVEAELGGVSELMTTVTYSQFVNAVENNQLIPGMKYRITDYVTKINGVYDLSLIGQTGAFLPYATSAEHQFDLIVTATGAGTYNENVKASLHSGDTYFSKNNLNAWELKWTHLNDINNYLFADITNGKGIITWMKDEFGNEAWYDFKNIMFLNFAMEKVDTNLHIGGGFDYFNHNIYSGTIFDVFMTLNQSQLWDNLQFGAMSLGTTSSIIILTSISDVSLEKLDTTFDWTYTLGLLSALMGTTVTLATLAYLLNMSEAQLSSMTEREIIRQIIQGDFFYTFDIRLNADTHKDLSVGYEDIDTGIWQNGGAYCSENKISHTADALTSFLSSIQPGIPIIPNGLNVITFQNDIGSQETRGNIIGEGSFLIVFGSGCVFNKMNGFSIRIGNASSYNSINFGRNVDVYGSSNNIGYNSERIYMGSETSGLYNDNIIGEGASDITLSNSSKNFIQDGQTISFYNSEHNTLIGDCRYITIENGSENIIISSHDITLTNGQNIIKNCFNSNFNGSNNYFELVNICTFSGNNNKFDTISNRTLYSCNNFSNIGLPDSLGSSSTNSSTQFTVPLEPATELYTWFRINIFDGTYEYCQTFSRNSLITGRAIIQTGGGNDIEFTLSFPSNSAPELTVSPTGVTVDTITIYGES